MSATARTSDLASQCGICGTLLSGPLARVFRVLGIKRSPRNPNICSRCDTHVHEGQLVEMTVLFADLSSFTELTQDIGAERTHEVVDAFLKTASAAITGHGGFIDKYIGDAVMALFNVPVRRVDHARQAVAAALELQSGMAAFSERFHMDLKAAVGIASGWARVGRLGSEESKDVTAIGDVVNLAARLESQTRPGEVLVSRDVYEKVAADFPGVPEERLALKGFRDPMGAHRLQARTDLPRAVAAPERELKRAVSWGAVIFGILGAPCAVTTLIGPLAVALGVGGVFGLAGILTYLDRSPWRVPVLIAVTLAALANLYTLWHARKIRQKHELVGMTRLDKRRTAIVLGTAILTIFMVIFEMIAHAVYHS